MTQNIMTNEQKLDEIYHIIKNQQAAATRAKWFRILKWCIILSVVYLISQNPELLIGTMTDLIMPTVMDNMKVMMERDSAKIMEQFKDIIPQIPQ